jgi:4-amino-4-deoxy-L-arabinose transferase-like glycosyltransferase
MLMLRREQKRDSVTEIPSPKTSRFLNIATISGLCLIVLFWGLGELPFYNRGEPREGLVVWEMNASGNWILPAVNGEYIPFKPPLFHWFAAVAGYLFRRIDEFTLRFPSAIFAALGVLMTYFAAARLWSERAALVAGIVLVTNAEWWQAGTDTQVDMTLAFFISAACLYFYFLYEQRNFGLVKCLGLPFLLGLATLSKGPIGFAVPCLVFLIFLGLRRDFAFVRKLHPFASTGVFLLVAGSWYSLALWQGGPAFFFRQIVDENFRTAAGTYGHYQPVYYYLPIFLENTLPWSFFFPAVALYIYQRRGKLSDEKLLFPLVWFVAVLVFFTASLGKRGVYILPLYPAIALLFGSWWQRLEEHLAPPDWLARAIGFLVAAFCLTALITLFCYFAAAYGLVDRGLVSFTTRLKGVSAILRTLTPPSPLVVACLVLYAGALWWFTGALVKRNWRRAFTSLCLITLAFTVIMKTVVLPPIVFERTMKPFMLRVNEKIDARLPLLFYRAFDLGAVFYSRRHIPSYAANANELKPPFYLLMWEEDWRPLAGRDELKMLDISEGRGPAGRHRLVLVEYQSNPMSTSKSLPVDHPAGSIDNYSD